MLKRKQDKLRRLQSTFMQDHGVQICSRQTSSASSVMSNADIMEIIFEGLPCTTDKANLAVTCKTWARMFLLHPKAPNWDVQYNKQLQRENKDGLTIISRGSLVISQRCRCRISKDEVARTMLHIRQHALKQCPHLEIVECSPQESDGHNFAELPPERIRRRKRWS